MSAESLSGVFILFGATGDLAARLVLPALHKLYQRGLISEKFVILGTSQEEMSDEEFANYARESIEESNQLDNSDEQFFKHCRYQNADNTEAEDLKQLLKKIKDVKQEFDTPEEFTYYYAIPPSLFNETTTNMNEAGLLDIEGTHRAVIEKPVGDSLDSAVEYYELLTSVFNEENIFFMDHFSGMDFIQNILATRFFNPFIENMWNHQFVDNIQISLPESLSVGTRGGFYEENGALLDMFQNHVLQTAVMVGMDLPDELSMEDIHRNKLAFFKSIPSLNQNEVQEQVVRGQYKADSSGEYTSYRNEDDVSNDSDTETYIAVQLSSDLKRWEGVPIYLRTGKALIENYFAVDLILKSPEDVDIDVPSRITFSATHPEGLSIVVHQKMPNNNWESITTFIGPDKKTFDDKVIPGPYENMIYDALTGNHMNFTTINEIKEQWRITDSIAQAWENMERPDFPNYEGKTFGPQAADDLLEKNGHQWIKRV